MCNKWSRVAQEQLYKNIVGFSSEKKFKSFINTISTSPSNSAIFIRSLDLRQLSSIQCEQGYIYELHLTKPEVGTIADHCGKLQSFKANSNSGRLWNGLRYQIVEKGNFKHFTSLPFPLVDDCVDYGDIAMASSKRLTSLVAHCPSTELNERIQRRISLFGYSIPIQKYVLIDSLSSFEKLEELTVIEIGGLGRSLSRYDYYVNQCPTTLKALLFQTAYYYLQAI